MMTHTFDHPHATNVPHPSDQHNGPQVPIGHSEGTTPTSALGPPELVDPTESESTQEDTMETTVSAESLLEEIREYKGRMRPIITKLLECSVLDDTSRISALGAVSLALEYIQWYATPGPTTKGTPKYMDGVDLWNRITNYTNSALPPSPNALNKEDTMNTPTTPTTPTPSMSIRTKIRNVINTMDILDVYTDIKNMRPWKGRDILMPLITSYPKDTEIEEIARGFIVLSAFQYADICSKAKWAYYYTRVEAYTPPTPPTPPVPLGKRVNQLGVYLRTKALGALDSLSTTGTMLAEQAGKDMGKYMAVTLHTATTVKRTIDKEWDRTHKASDIRARARHMTRKMEWKSAMAVQRMENKDIMERELRESIAAMAMDTGVQPPELGDGAEVEL